MTSPVPGTVTEPRTRLLRATITTCLTPFEAFVVGKRPMRVPQLMQAHRFFTRTLSVTGILQIALVGMALLVPNLAWADGAIYALLNGDKFTAPHSDAEGESEPISLPRTVYLA
jgi:hypothetical protein